MKIRKLSIKEYNEYLKSNPANPFQTEGMYNRLHKPAIYGGYDKEGNLVITAMGDFKPFKKVFRYFYIPYGVVTSQPFNMELLDDFFKSLKRKFAFTNTIAIQLDPAIEIESMDGFGKPNISKNDYFSNKDYRDKMESIGFKLLPKTTDVSKMCNPRQVAIIDLAQLENYKGIITHDTILEHVYTDDEQLDMMKGRTKRYMKQAVKDYIKVEDSNIDKLIEMGEKSGEAKQFEFFNRKSLEEIVKGYDNDCAIRHCYLDVIDYKQHTLNQIEDIDKEIERLKSTNANRKIKAKEQEKMLLEATLQEIKELKEPKISLACGLFLYSSRETYFLASGVDRNYRKYQGASRLNWDEMQRSKARGAWKYNMLGIAGTYKEDDPNEPLISFKRDLGAHIAEYQGMMFYKVHNTYFDELVQMYWGKS